MTLSWHRPVILIEADPSKPSSVLPGFLRGGVQALAGLDALTQLSTGRPGALNTGTIWNAGRPFGQTPGTNQPTSAKFVHGFTNLAAARHARSVWGDLSRGLTDFEAGGVDVIVDFGRWTHPTERDELIRRADFVAWAGYSSLTGVNALRAELPTVTQIRSTSGRAQSQAALLFAPAVGGYSVDEVRKVLGGDVMGTVPYNAKGAAYYAFGEGTRSNAVKLYTRHIRGIGRSLYGRAQESVQALSRTGRGA